LGETGDAIWRYFDFPKFVSALENRGLFFCRADLLGDPLEGSYTRRMLEIKARYLSKLQPGQTLAERERNLAIWEKDDRACRTCTYVNCWHIGEHESMAMWQGYGGGPYGIAIQSTIRRLDECLPTSITAVNEVPTIALGRVRYIDYSSSAETIFSGGRDFGHVIENFFAKSVAYRHEQEFRAAFFNVEALRVKPRPNPVGFWVRMDLKAIVQSIRVSPLSPPWFQDLVGSTCQRFGLDIPLEPSAMIAPPVF
jgi:hypothetical protein